MSSHCPPPPGGPHMDNAPSRRLVADPYGGSAPFGDQPPDGTVPRRAGAQLGGTASRAGHRERVRAFQHRSDHSRGRHGGGGDGS